MKKRDSYARWGDRIRRIGRDDGEAMGAGVLHAETAAARFTLSRHPPPDDLAPFLDYWWVVRWDLRGQPPHEQAILPHPNVNLAFEASGAAVFGVDRSIFTRRLTGAGKALGVRFRPGGFRPFYRKPIATLNDRVVPARQVFGPAADEACAAVMSTRRRRRRHGRGGGTRCCAGSAPHRTRWPRGWPAWSRGSAPTPGCAG